MGNNFSHQLDNILRTVGMVADQNNLETYVIGGYVRDLILKIPSKDMDFVVAGSGIELAERVGQRLGCKRDVVVFKNFGTAMIKYRNIELEFVGARKESYNKNSRKPEVQAGTIKDDQLRRDFTINALAISLNEKTFGELTDPFNGLNDLRNKIIRTPTDPDITFSDDPLRMMRAIRFACRLNFTIEPNTEQAIIKNRERIKIVSTERIIDEINKFMVLEKPSRGWLLMLKTGLLDIILPQLSKLKGVEIREGCGHKDNFYHTMQVLDNVAASSDNIWLRWAALFHDIAKPNVKKFINGAWTFHSHEFLGAKMIPSLFKSLKLPLGEPMKYVQKLVGMHHRAIPISNKEITDSAVRRLMYDAGDDLDDLLLLCEADITSKIEEKRTKFLNNYQIVREKIKQLEQKDFLRTWQPPIDGNYIMKVFDIAPGRLVGQIKDRIKNAILDGEIENSFQAAEKLMFDEGKKYGLTVK